MEGCFRPLSTVTRVPEETCQNQLHTNAYATASYGLGQECGQESQTLAHPAGSEQRQGWFEIVLKATCQPESHTRFVRKIETIEASAWVSPNLKVGLTRLLFGLWEFPKPLKKTLFLDIKMKTYRTNPMHGVWRASLQKSTRKTEKTGNQQMSEMRHTQSNGISVQDRGKTHTYTHTRTKANPSYPPPPHLNKPHT